MITVLIVDDSVFMRTILKDIIGRDPEIEVLGTAVDGIDALAKIERLEPDVVTLDIEMPRMNGIEVLQKIQRSTFSKMPRIIMVSSLTSDGAEMTLKAIRLGASDFLLKPTDIRKVRAIEQEITSKIKHLVALQKTAPRVRATRPAPEVTPKERVGAETVVLIGSSAGGPQMLDSLLSMLPPDLGAGVVITQHMPVGFTAALAERFNRLCPMPVKETENGDRIDSNRVLLSKAGYHTIITNAQTTPGRVIGKVVHSSGQPLHGVKPAVDKTFVSASQIFGKRIVSVILSGMGSDGGVGMKAIRDAGGQTYVVLESECLVYGMARSALDHDAVMEVVPMRKMADEITRAVRKIGG
ncbi:MAG: chemotaxis-specific protein-glutamate methyltransferase CheB [Methanocalculus sp. MSAO_Arc1]|uniref:chemotaxis-specific protein-glutamate methyltransferase CheB n=1 Tax=Methanocalculus TaxID=71151 RepID=UPI000FEF5625|nr:MULTISPECIES: chemotaxis-specific protein-glutamate methyltransferase CheB [unclassified Methanocalculus]MCP1661935.1 two-component system chemotaxis response regulator CheB [Methanocalculus sp. AMF5]RQD80551.1 MAG: chemotaxis-specific protein-glutamate methyltransferase CheB [Methanocalculus sp. MSAO_Arc1]